MNCPICKKEMTVETYEGVEIDVCEGCGVWLDMGELGKIIAAEEVRFNPKQVKETVAALSREKEDQEVLMGILQEFKAQGMPDYDPQDSMDVFKKRWRGERVIQCPKCSQTLKEFEYEDSTIMLDQCPDGHGFWLDEGEIDKVQIISEYNRRRSSPDKASESRTETVGSIARWIKSQ